MAFVALMDCGPVLLVPVRAAGDKPAPPAISPRGIVNAASRTPPTLPGGALAPGTRISIFGPRLAVEQQGEGVVRQLEVLLRQGRWTGRAQVLAATGRQIDAVLPDDIPLGTVEVLVRAGGQTSEPREVQIAAASPGIFLVSPPEQAEALLAAGMAPGEFRYVTAQVKPGERMWILATGLGRTVEVSVLVGGHSGQGTRKGPLACCPGVEVVEFTIPANRRSDCRVPVRIRPAGGPVSNTVFVDVSAGGPCEPALPWAEFLPGQRIGTVAAIRTRLYLDGYNGRDGMEFLWDYALASFRKTEAGSTDLGLTAPGTCATVTGVLRLGGLLRPGPLPWESKPAEELAEQFGPADAIQLIDRPGGRTLETGTDLILERGNQQRQVPKKPESSLHTATIGGSHPGSWGEVLPLFLGRGRIAIRSDGGGEVGPFRAEMQYPQMVEWTNREQIRAVDRSSGVTVRWKPRERTVALVVAMNADERTGAVGVCLCTVPGGAGRFRVPAEALGGIPLTDEDSGKPLHLLGVGLIDAEPKSFAAKGLDRGLAVPVSLSFRTVEYR